jgi:serine/threonine-protein kinase
LTGAVIGTPEYLAPEQILDSSRIGPPTDVYQLGVLLFEMLTGITPLARSTYEAQLAAILTDEPARLRTLRPDVSGELEHIVTKATHRDLASRTPDARTFAEELRTYRAHARMAHSATVLAPRAGAAQSLPTPVPPSSGQPRCDVGGSPSASARGSVASWRRSPGSWPFEPPSTPERLRCRPET